MPFAYGWYTATSQTTESLARPPSGSRLDHTPLLLGVPDVRLLGVIDLIGERVVTVIEERVGATKLPGMSRAAAVKEPSQVTNDALACFGRAVGLVWRKHRWSARTRRAPVGSWTGEGPSAAPTTSWRPSATSRNDPVGCAGDDPVTLACGSCVRLNELLRLRSTPRGRHEIEAHRTA